MDNMPLVSVIMNCYNGEKFLRDAIDSVYNQTYENWEIIFWDNNSSDGSAKIAAEYDDKLKYYRSEVTTTLYEARNKSIDKCQGEAIAFLDCDDLWRHDKLDKQVSKYNKGNMFIYGAFELIDQEGGVIYKKLAKLKSGNVTKSLIMKNFISIGSVLVDASILKELKFNSSYNLIGDFDLWIRISLKTKFSFVDGIVEESRQHNSNLSSLLKNDWILEQRKLYKWMYCNLDLSLYIYIFVFVIKSELRSILIRLNKR